MRVLHGLVMAERKRRVDAIRSVELAKQVRDLVDEDVRLAITAWALGGVERERPEGRAHIDRAADDGAVTGLRDGGVGDDARRVRSGGRGGRE